MAQYYFPEDPNRPTNPEFSKIKPEIHGGTGLPYEKKNPAPIGVGNIPDNYSDNTAARSAIGLFTSQVMRPDSVVTPPKMIQPAVISSGDARKKTNMNMQKLGNMITGYQQFKPVKKDKGMSSTTRQTATKMGTGGDFNMQMLTPTGVEGAFFTDSSNQNVLFQGQVIPVQQFMQLMRNKQYGVR